jgi:recombination protein RecT
MTLADGWKGKKVSQPKFEEVVETVEPPVQSAESTEVVVAPPKNPYKDALVKAEEQIRSVLPSYLTPERMMQIAVMSVYKSPLLQKCHPMSVVAAVIDAAVCGLEPGGPMQHGDLLPVWNSKANGYECQFRPRYGGMIQLARNTELLSDIYAEVVYLQDEFEYELGLNRKLYHKRARATEPRKDEDITESYAVAKLLSGEVNFTVLERWEIEKIRAKSETEKAKRAGKIKVQTTWEEWYSEMAKKTAIKRLAKVLPKSSRLAHAIDLDNRDYEAVDTGTVAKKPLFPVKEEGAA